MPAIGYALGGVDFTSLFAVIKDGDPAGPYNTVAQAKEAGAVTINYGIFINSIIVFIIVALVLFFLVKAYMRTQKPAEVTTKDCPYCLTAIPLAAIRCPACTSELTGDKA
jgi:large conductance mechanosensitive channel